MSLGNWLLLPAGLLLSIAAFTMRARMGFFYCVVSFSLLAVGFSCLVLAALVPDGLLQRLRFRALKSLAVWSYAIYLSHVFALAAASELCRRAGFARDGLALMLLSVTTILCFGALLYYGVERRFTR